MCMLFKLWTHTHLASRRSRPAALAYLEPSTVLNCRSSLANALKTFRSAPVAVHYRRLYIRRLCIKRLCIRRLCITWVRIGVSQCGFKFRLSWTKFSTSLDFTWTAEALQTFLDFSTCFFFHFFRLPACIHANMRSLLERLSSKSQIDVRWT